MTTTTAIKRPTEQVYSNYTAEDFHVWKTLYNRQMATLRTTVSQAYLDALNVVGFNANEIPDFKKVDARLKPLTGWGIQVVPNISPQKEFFEFLTKKKFTATCWLRTFEQLDFLEEPDMFHDVFAHVPLLSNKAYCDFFHGIGEIAMEHIDNPKAIEMLGRIYWFTVEFGLIREKGELKIYGAGIISSHGETEHSLHDKTKKFDFDVATIFHTSFRTDIMQDKYCIIDSFDQLYHSLPEIKRLLSKEL